VAEALSQAACVRRHAQYRTLDEENKHPRQQERLNKVASLIDEGVSVVDIGSNTGYMQVLLDGKLTDYQGIDCSKLAVAEAERLGRSVQYGIAEELPLPDKSYDVAILSEVLEHVYSPHAVMVEAARVARQTIVVSTPIPNSEWGRNWPFHPYHVRIFTQQQLESLLGEFGETEITQLGYFQYGRCQLAP